VQSSLILEKISIAVKQYFNEANIGSAVIALSGGIDSAVAAKIAIDILTPPNVKLFYMPYKLSNKQSELDANEFANRFNTKLDTINLTDIADRYFILDDTLDNIRRGNFLSRLRMNIIFDQASKYRSLVIGTSNKTERLLGYGTWHGDMASSINPIGDLYKFQIYELAEHLSIPQSIIDKKPSADLWTDQYDEEELGFSYKDIDSLLYAVIDDRVDRDILNQRFDSTLIDFVLTKVINNSFKRKLPFICKVINHDNDNYNEDIIFRSVYNAR